MLENNGYSGSLPQVGRHESADGGRFFSYFRNVNGDSTIIEAEAVRATSFAFMEQQTGLEFDPAWFDTTLTTYRIPDPYTIDTSTSGH